MHALLRPLHWLRRRLGGPLLHSLGAAGDLLYPARCSACDARCEQAAAFCEECAEQLEPIEGACIRCGLPLPVRTTCLACLERSPPYRTALAPFLFGGPIARAVRRMKWGREPELSGPLGRLLTIFARRLRPDLIVPVPLHPRRLRSRQFNQAALLALAARAGPRSPPVDVHLLERVRDTLPQTELDARARRRNVRGAFRVVHNERLRGRRVLLVDDVLTTGATADACAETLREAGAAEVLVLTLARAMP